MAALKYYLNVGEINRSVEKANRDIRSWRRRHRLCRAQLAAEI